MCLTETFSSKRLKNSATSLLWHFSAFGSEHSKQTVSFLSKTLPFSFSRCRSCINFLNPTSYFAQSLSFRCTAGTTKRTSSEKSRRRSWLGRRLGWRWFKTDGVPQRNCKPVRSFLNKKLLPLFVPGYLLPIHIERREIFVFLVLALRALSTLECSRVYHPFVSPIGGWSANHPLSLFVLKVVLINGCNFKNRFGTIIILITGSPLLPRLFKCRSRYSF